MKVEWLSRVGLLATPGTAAYQAPPSMGFSRQEYWTGVPLAETWMDLEAVTQSESEREKQILHNITYMWNQEKWYR